MFLKHLIAAANELFARFWLVVIVVFRVANRLSPPFRSSSLSNEAAFILALLERLHATLDMGLCDLFCGVWTGFEGEPAT